MTFIEFLPALLRGGVQTLGLVAAGGTLGVLIAIVVGYLRLFGPKPLASVAFAFTTFVRGTSAIVQLFWVFFVLPVIGIELQPATAMIATLAVNAGAYGAEIIRGAVQSLDRGQTDAALSLGLPPLVRVTRIYLWQALPAIIPPMGVLVIEVLKLTALASLVTITDLTYAAQLFRTATGETLQIFAAVLVLYFLIASAIDIVFRHLSRAVSYPGFAPPSPLKLELAIL